MARKIEQASYNISEATNAALQKIADDIRWNPATGALRAGLNAGAEAVDRVRRDNVSDDPAGEGQWLDEESDEFAIDTGYTDPEKPQVVLRIEIGDSGEGKLLRFIMILLMIGSLAGCIVIGVRGGTEVTRSAVVSYAKTATAILGVLLLVLVVTGIVFVVRLIDARSHGQVWSRRRATVVAYSFGILLVQVLSVMFSLMGVATLLRKFCADDLRNVLVYGYMQWTCWGMFHLMVLSMCHNNMFAKKSERFHKKYMLVMDGNQARAHLAKGVVLWVPFQILISLILWRFLLRVPSGCGNNQQFCTQEDLVTVLASLLILLMVIYFFVVYYFTWKAFQDLEAKRYVETRFIRMISGLESQLVMPIFFIITIGVAILLSTGAGSCWPALVGWLGVPTLQTMGTCMAFALAWFCMPISPESKSQLLSSWLQEFAWTYESLPAAIASRNARLSSSTELANSPMFCMETAIKLLYFSSMAYDVQDANPAVEDIEKGSSDNEYLHTSTHETNSVAKRSGSMGGSDEGVTAQLGVPTITVALSLFGMANHDVIDEPKSDTRALMCWGNGNLVLSFRGTSSLENALTDINFMKCVHAPYRWHAGTSLWGLRKIKSVVRVHRGFYNAWTGSGYSKKVLKRLNEALQSMQGADMVKIYVTGHSLGGALATLAAHDIKKQFPHYPVTVYTFGQPRVGNYAFAKEYNSIIKDHFAIINEQDPVSFVPKGLYKRAGQRIRINGKGDIMVSPTFLEMQLFQERG